MPNPRSQSARRPYGHVALPNSSRRDLITIFRDTNGEFYTDHPFASGPFSNSRHVCDAISRSFRIRRERLVMVRYESATRLRVSRGAPSPVVTEDQPPPPPRSDKLVDAVAESASALTLQEADISSSEEFLENTSLKKFVAVAAESSSPETLQEPDVSSLDELLGATSTEEPIIAGPQTVLHDAVGGSSSTPPYSRKKFIVGAIESSYPQTPEEHKASLKELLDALFLESMASSPRTVPHDASYSSPTPASSLGSSILSRSPPNWYGVFYIRMDRRGSFYMYPDLGGPFRCLDEADIAINRYLDELQHGAGCKEQGNLNIVDRMVHSCKYYLNGTPRRGPNSPSSKTYDEKRYLLQALLDQYSDDHNLFGNLELEDILMRQWIYEDHRWFYHFNFTTKKSEADDNPSAGRLFFAEVSHMQGEDALEVNCCCMIEDEDNGWCYGCRNNGSLGMKHPKSTDAYTGGHLDVYLPFDSVELSSSEDEDDEDTKLRHMFEGLDDPHVWDYLFPSGRSVDVVDIDC